MVSENTKIKAHEFYSKYGKVNAVGVCGNDEISIRFEKTDIDPKNIPDSFGGHRVNVKVTGPIVPL